MTEAAARFRPVFGVRPDPAWRQAAELVDAMPPPSLRRLHSHWLFDSAWRRVVDAIREPVEVFDTASGRRHVQVLGAAVYTIGPDGRLSGCLWRPGAALVPEPETRLPAELTIDDVPWRWCWLERWQHAFSLEVAWSGGSGGVAATLQEAFGYAQWAFGVFRSRIRRGCELRTMRRRIARALALDPLALEVARRLCLTERRPLASMALYNRALEHLGAHRKLERDAPRLHLTDALLGHGVDTEVEHGPPEDEPLQRLRRRLRARGLSSRAWRLLLRSGARLWRPMSRLYLRGDADAAWDYLALLDGLGWQGEPDARVMQLLLAQYGSSDRRRLHYASRYLPELPLLQSVVRRYESIDEAEREAMRNGLPAVLGWLDQLERPPGRPGEPLPAWHTLLRRGRQAEQEELRLAQAIPSPWPCPVREGEQGRLVFVMLRSAAELHEEGQAMRHCALRFADACAMGSAAIASVRDRSSGRRVATVMWVRDGDEWVVGETVGVANGPVSEGVRQGVGRLRLRPA